MAGSKMKSKLLKIGLPVLTVVIIAVVLYVTIATITFRNSVHVKVSNEVISIGVSK